MGGLQLYITYLIINLQYFAIDRDSKRSCSRNYSTSKKPAFELSAYIFGYWPLGPYVYLVSTHLVNVLRPSLSSASMYDCEQKWKVETGNA